jgi:hypothetical protein
MQIPTQTPANSLPPITAFIGTAEIWSYEIEEGDDVLNQDPELSAQEMYVRLAAVPWLSMRLEETTQDGPTAVHQRLRGYGPRRHDRGRSGLRQCPHFRGRVGTIRGLRSGNPVLSRS